MGQDEGYGREESVQEKYGEEETAVSAPGIMGWS
jgi:hypothetical protein